MEKLLLAETKTAMTCRGETMELCYYLVQGQTPDGIQYGVEICARTPEERTQARAEKLTTCRARAEQLLAQLRRGMVTPTGLPDVVQDWL